MSIIEQAVLLGKRHSLVGILAQAAVPAPIDVPAIVILNTGIIHRVGHNRMFVTMSRVFARAGHAVLRFDFSGIGDSEPQIDGVSLLESCLSDIREALDWLEKEHQTSRVILVGLCSGADHAILYGHTDKRVVAVVLLDPSIPATTRYYLHYIGRRLMGLRHWLGLMGGKSYIIKMWMNHVLYVMRPELKSREITLSNLRFHSHLEQSYRNSIANGIQILAVFTNHPTRQTYREQMIDAFPNVPFGNQLKLELFLSSDHLFTVETDRAKLTDLILAWMHTINCNSLLQH